MAHINHFFFAKQRTKYLVFSAIIILHNCSKASENRPILNKLRAKERIAPFIKVHDLEIAVPAILTLAYITSEEEKKLLEVDSRVCILMSTKNKKGRPAKKHLPQTLACFTMSWVVFTRRSLQYTK